jgi:hypothetical protein
MREIVELLGIPLPDATSEEGKKVYENLMKSTYLDNAADGTTTTSDPTATHFLIRNTVEQHACKSINEVTRVAPLPTIVRMARDYDSLQKWLVGAFEAQRAEEPPTTFGAGSVLSVAYKARSSYQQALRQRHRSVGRSLAEAYTSPNRESAKDEIREGIASIAAVGETFYRTYVEVRLIRRVMEVAKERLETMTTDITAIMKYIADETAMARDLLPEGGVKTVTTTLARATEGYFQGKELKDFDELLKVKGPRDIEVLAWIHVLPQLDPDWRKKIAKSLENYALWSLERDTTTSLISRVCSTTEDIAACFDRHKDAERTLQRALGLHLNSTGGMSSGAFVHEMHNLIRSSMSLQPQQCEGIAAVLTALPNKSELQEQYWAQLAMRLLHGPNIAVERTIVSLISTTCGKNFASRFTKMIEDITSSCALLDAACPSAPFPMHVSILTAMQWPNLRVDYAPLPMPFNEYIRPVSNLFALQGERRRLSWSMHLGEVHLKWSHDGEGTSMVITSPVYAAILLHFNDNDTATLPDVTKAIAVSTDMEVESSLNTLVAANVLCLDKGTYRVAQKAHRSRIAFGISAAAVTSLGTDSRTPQRKAATEAAVARIVKRRGSILVAALPMTVRAELREVIVPSSIELDEVVRTLCAREIIALDGDAFRYLP